MDPQKEKNNHIYSDRFAYDVEIAINELSDPIVTIRNDTTDPDRYVDTDLIILCSVVSFNVNIINYEFTTK